jgi:hypothetical protein
VIESADKAPALFFLYPAEKTLKEGLHSRRVAVILPILLDAADAAGG